jgi:predicted AAA+ superfamily ATPase
MFANNVFTDGGTSSENGDERTDDEVRGLIAALKRGDISQFDFRGLKIMQVSGKIYVVDSAIRRTLGGTAPASNDVNAIFEWLLEKHELYSEEQQ